MPQDYSTMVLDALFMSNEAMKQRGRWSTVAEVDAFRQEAGIKAHITTNDLEQLVTQGTAEKTTTNLVKIPDIQGGLTSKFILYRAIPSTGRYGEYTQKRRPRRTV